MLEQHLTTNNYLNFMVALLMGHMPLKTRNGRFFEHSGASPHFGLQDTV
jgi:hypothetical protein